MPTSDTLAFLEQHGYVRDGRVWTAGLIEQLRDLLLAQPVETTDAVEITQKARTPDELYLAIFPDDSAPTEEVELEVLRYITTLVAASPKGRVQRALENGYVLCTATVPRVMDDGEAPVGKRARFVSENPDVVERYFETPLIDRAVKSATNASDGMEMAGRRIPVLAQRRPTLARKAQEQLALAMPLDGES